MRWLKLFLMRPKRYKLEKVSQARVPNFTVQRDEALNQRSAIYWLDKLPANAPILLIHGDLDRRVDVSQSYMMADALKAMNHP